MKIALDSLRLFKSQSQEISFPTLFIYYLPPSPTVLFFVFFFWFHQDRKSTNIVWSSTAGNRHYFIHSLHVMFQPTLVWKNITCENARNMIKIFGSFHHQFHWRKAKCASDYRTGKKEHTDAEKHTEYQNICILHSMKHRHILQHFTTFVGINWVFKMVIFVQQHMTDIATLTAEHGKQENV